MRRQSKFDGARWADMSRQGKRGVCAFLTPAITRARRISGEGGDRFNMYQLINI